MSLRTVAEADLATILESETCGFAWPIKLTNPAGLEKDLFGQSPDIAQLIDPDTGVAVSGRTASATLRLSSIYSSDPGPAMTIPEALADTTGKPWLVEFNDINGNPYTFSVVKSLPDRMLGVIVLVLQTYKKEE